MRSNGNPGSRKNDFEEVERALTVNLILVPVGKLKTCTKDECPDVVRKSVRTLRGFPQGASPFDYLPVKDGEGGPIVGFFRIAPADGAGAPADCTGADRVGDSAAYEPLSEKHLIGSGTSILEFIRRVDDTPRPFLVVGEEGICGMVNAADVAHPIVGAAICVRVLEFETRMNGWIEERFGDGIEWRGRLDNRAFRKIDDLHGAAAGKHIEPSRKWMCGTIGDKMAILGVDAETQRRIKELRNAVFHTRPPSKVQAVLKELRETEEDLAQQHEPTRHHPPTAP